MKVAFYCRLNGKCFGCLLPDEKEKLWAFLNAEQKSKAEESPESNRQLNFEKG